MMNIFSLTMQHWPDDIELLNKEIADYHLLNGFFPTLEFAEPDHRTAQEIYRWMESQITARTKQKIGGGPRKKKRVVDPRRRTRQVTRTSRNDHVNNLSVDLMTVDPPTKPSFRRTVMMTSCSVVTLYLHSSVVALYLNLSCIFILVLWRCILI
jgi:hypothetical protein